MGQIYNVWKVRARKRVTVWDLERLDRLYAASSSVLQTGNVSAIGVTPTLASVIMIGSEGQLAGRLNVML